MPNPEASEEPFYLALTLGSIRVEWEDIGEGWSGDYNPEDPQDQELLRFTVARREGLQGEWQQVDDASYCTAMPVDTPIDILISGLAYILGRVYDATLAGESIKVDCEELSWLSPERMEHIHA